MKREEKTAKHFLRMRIGLGPDSEPPGPSRPPEFRIRPAAFETSRLNENYTGRDGKPEGAEEAGYSLIEAV